MTGLDTATPLADTVLFEGYVLYPYRANDAKNRVRWQFGVLMPPAFANIDPSERSFLQTDLLLDGPATAETVLTARLRFLHVHRRTVERRDGEGFAPVASLDVGDATYLPCDEAAVHEADLEVNVEAATPPGCSAGRTLVLDGGEQIDLLHDAAGVVVGRLVRHWLPGLAQLHVNIDPLPGPYGVRRIRIRADNRTPWSAPVVGSEPVRADALQHALVAAHVIAGVAGGRFISQLDPPEWARSYVAQCENVGVFPVLAGPPQRDDVVLASPIILYDHAEVAPESAIAFCDGTEMDEMLTLRAMTLTDQEKREVRGSDARAAGIVDGVDALPPAVLERLHGAIRSMSAVATPVASARNSEPVETLPWWDPRADAALDPDGDQILIAGVPVRRGTGVRLRPGSKRADAQDMFLDGRLGHVEAVVNDVDGQVHLAVALDELVDLADGINPHGRFLYFAPDEVEPIGQGT